RDGAQFRVSILLDVSEEMLMTHTDLGSRFAPLVICIVVVFFGASTLHATINVPYQVTSLGTLGGTFVVPRDINMSGQVVGYSTLAGDNAQHAFLYDGVMHDLGTLGGIYSDADGINAAGQVTGAATRNDGTSLAHAYLYDGQMHDLGILGG